MWDMCQMLNIWHISHTKPSLSHLSDVLNPIFFATCYSTITNLQLYGKLWHNGLLIFYYSFTLISLSSSLSSHQNSPPPSPLFHSLSSFIFPVALFSSHSWIWAIIDFLSTITDLYPSPVFFPLLFTCFFLFYWRGSGCGSRLRLWFPIVGLVIGLVVISDCDRRGHRSLGCGSLLSVLYPGELTEPFRLIRK